MCLKSATKKLIVALKSYGLNKADRVRGSNPVLAELIFQPIISVNFEKEIFGGLHA